MASITINEYSRKQKQTNTATLNQIMSGQVYAKRQGQWIIPLDSSGAPKKYPTKVHKHYVYFVNQDRHNLTKVGTTQTLPSRLRQLQVGNPFALKLVGYMYFDCRATAFNAESIIKKEILSSRNWFRGEWFESVDVNECIGELLSTYKHANSRLIESKLLPEGISDIQATDYFKRIL